MPSCASHMPNTVTLAVRSLPRHPSSFPGFVYVQRGVRSCHRWIELKKEVESEWLTIACLARAGYLRLSA